MVPLAAATVFPANSGCAALTSAIRLSVSVIRVFASASRPEGLADERGLVLPRGLPVAARLGDGRRDLGQLRVLVRGEAGLHREDHVGLERRDLLQRQRLARLGQQHRLGVAELLLHPRHDSAAVLTELRLHVAHAHRRHAEGDRGLGAAPAEGDHALRPGLDLGGAERRGDRHGEARVVLCVLVVRRTRAARRSAHEQGGCGGDGHDRSGDAGYPEHGVSFFTRCLCHWTQPLPRLAKLL